LASAALSTSSVAKALSTNSQDQNAALAPAAPKPHAAKVAVDKKRMDARKKSLKRL
jgi:ubiquitin-conjugating enzyme E2 S